MSAPAPNRTPAEILPAAALVIALLLTVAPHLSAFQLLPAEHAVTAGPPPPNEVSR